ncbi:hypothetical protein UFOVP130_25 [uncultured Caudovirales phage]|uniref:Uncharacterized protein n=1 Tax=uncultured Caudovirales phage TaxID=2100421 RepID=A0A6J5LBX6_9CAUD|nr:hypothetical protein UFOVP130_25 [uncultured Caudovirales phage]
MKKIVTLLLCAAAMLAQTAPTQVSGSTLASSLPGILNGNFNSLYNTQLGRSVTGFGYSFPGAAGVPVTRYMTVPFACTINAWNMTVEGGAATTANLTNASNLLALTSGTGIWPGQTVTGTGIAGGTTVASQPGLASLSMSQAATATGFTNLTFTANTTGNTTNTSTTVTVASATGLAVGQTVTGTGIAGSTTVAALVGTTVTLSAAATATGTGVALSFTTGSYAYATNADVNVIIPTANAAIAAGMTITGTNTTGTATVSTYAAGPAVMLSAAATATSTGTALTFKNSATVDIWKVATGSTLPTVANTITAGAVPSLTGNAVSSTTLTNWTTAVSANDILAFNLSSVGGNPASVGIVLGCAR